MSVEQWKTIFDWATVVLVGLTFVAGAGALCTGNILSERQSAQLMKFEIDLETQKEKTATAEAVVLRLQKARLPRMLHFDSNESLQALTASLKRNPLPTEIVYKKDDSEAYAFAEQIWALLSSARWQVPRPEPVPDDISADVLEQMGAQPLGVTIVVKAIPANETPDDPLAIVTGLLSKSLGSVARSPDPRLQDNAIKIIILQKP